jgi:hypothetical protein
VSWTKFVCRAIQEEKEEEEEGKKEKESHKNCVMDFLIYILYLKMRR